MGVQILSKDVTVISSIGAVSKNAINNVMGATGWLVTTTTTPAPVVIPSPTPDWPNVTTAGPIVDTSARITGITTSITLGIYWTASGGTLYVTTNTVNSFPGSVTTQLTASPTNITVNPNDYVIFRLANPAPGSQNAVGNVTNVSNSGTLLDTFTIVSNN